MTDEQKIAFLVERLFGGKWPDHNRIHVAASCGPETFCVRCRGFRRASLSCKRWNPLLYLEDAFVVVEAMRKKHGFGLVLSDDPNDAQGMWFCSFFGGNSKEIPGDTPQQAIVKAAISALESK